MPRTRPDVHAQAQEIVAKRLAGRTIPELAREYHCSNPTIEGICAARIPEAQRRQLAAQSHANAIAPHRPYCSSVHEKLDEIITRWRAGGTAEAMAKEYGCSPSTIKDMLRKALGAEYRNAYAVRMRQWLKRCAFKKGHSSGQAARMELPLFSVRLRNSKNKGHGKRYYIKIHNRYKGGWSNWQLYSHYVWEHANSRKVPAGYFVGHADGNERNDAPDNLILVSRVDKMREVVRAIYSNPKTSRKRLRNLRRAMVTQAESRLMRRVEKCAREAQRLRNAGLPHTCEHCLHMEELNYYDQSCKLHVDCKGSCGDWTPRYRTDDEEDCVEMAMEAL